jgi:cobalt-zinc-cadmium efflux system outer membrane protein
MSLAPAAIRQAERNLTLETVRLYLTALQAHLRTEFLLSNRNELEPLLAMMRRRVAEGYTAEADLMKFRTEAARLDTQITRSTVEFNQAATLLTALLDFADPITAARLVKPPALAPPRRIRWDWLQQAVERLPEIVSARARLVHAQQVLELEKARRLPDPTLIAGYKRTGGADTLVTGVIVPLPLFDQNTGNIERATADEQAAAFELDALRTQQLAAMVVLIQSAQALTERAQHLDQQLLQPAEIVRNAARSSFREGAANILQLVDAERVYTETQEKRSKCNSKPMPNPLKPAYC